MARALSDHLAQPGVHHSHFPMEGCHVDQGQGGCSRRRRPASSFPPGHFDDAVADVDGVTLDVRRDVPDGDVAVQGPGQQQVGLGRREEEGLDCLLTVAASTLLAAAGLGAVGGGGGSFAGGGA